MEANTEFPSFPKIFRLNREVIATEKLDGTNGLIYISDDLTQFKIGSRSRWITSKDDNYGFANWAEKNEEELRKLGPGHHYGEWWGQGIQRNYRLKEKRFSLFNASRWTDDAVRPTCCSVVPILSRGLEIRTVTEQALSILREKGSVAVPGFMKPEGVVIFHSPSRHLYKVTLEKDESPKGTE